MKKELYLSPVVELEVFDKKDIIVTSGPNEGEPVIANEDVPGQGWTDNA